MVRDELKIKVCNNNNLWFFLLIRQEECRQARARTRRALPLEWVDPLTIRVDSTSTLWRMRRTISKRRQMGSRKKTRRAKLSKRSTTEISARRNRNWEKYISGLYFGRWSKPLANQRESCELKSTWRMKIFHISFFLRFWRFWVCWWRHRLFDTLSDYLLKNSVFTRLSVHDGGIKDCDYKVE